MDLFVYSEAVLYLHITLQARSKDHFIMEIAILSSDIISCHPRSKIQMVVLRCSKSKSSSHCNGVWGGGGGAWWWWWAW